MSFKFQLCYIESRLGLLDYINTTCIYAYFRSSNDSHSQACIYFLMKGELLVCMHYLPKPFVNELCASLLAYQWLVIASRSYL